MTPSEVSLFRSLLVCSSHYAEFGSGGSTVLAASLVQASVTTVDSSKEWLDRVREACVAQQCRVAPTLVHADIGVVKELGYPADDTRMGDWHAYHGALRDRDGGVLADLVLVDGRFRVACFVQTLLWGNPDSVIAVHDFTRPQYQVVHELAREVARAESLSVFVRRPGLDRKRALDVLKAHELVTD